MGVVDRVRIDADFSPADKALFSNDGSSVHNPDLRCSDLPTNGYFSGWLRAKAVDVGRGRSRDDHCFRNLVSEAEALTAVVRPTLAGAAEVGTET